MKKYKSKTIRAKLDKLVGGFFRSRPCDRCKKITGEVQIHWSHLKSRKFLSTRWSLLNSFSHCASCHRYFHDHPDEFVKWIELNYPNRLEELQKIFIVNKPIKDWELEEKYEQLKQQLT